LANLSIFDESVFDKYTNMNAVEWTKYSYTKAMEYYSALEQLYATDKAKLIEI